MRTTALQIAATQGSRALTPEQKRFNSLIKQIEKARQTLKAWQDGSVQYGQIHTQALLPLQETLQAVQREWVLKLDALSQKKVNLTKSERYTLSELITAMTGGLLELDRNDVQLKAVFERHTGADFEAQHQEMLRALKNFGEFASGMDLGDDEGITSADDVLERLHKGMQSRAAAESARRETQAARRPKTAAQKKREDEAQQATQSVREVFRKLASALHPDREPDLAQREIKNNLMQEVNQAYARNDLLSLLELQLRVEQIDAGHMAQADPQKIKRFNRVLAEQLDDLKGEIAAAEVRFVMTFDLSPMQRLDPKKLGALAELEAHDIQAAIADLRAEIDLFDNLPQTKRWLKAEYQALQEERAGDMGGMGGMGAFDLF